MGESNLSRDRITQTLGIASKNWAFLKNSGVFIIATSYLQALLDDSRQVTRVLSSVHSAVCPCMDRTFSALSCYREALMPLAGVIARLSLRSRTWLPVVVLKLHLWISSLHGATGRTPGNSKCYGESGSDIKKEGKTGPQTGPLSPTLFIRGLFQSTRLCLKFHLKLNAYFTGNMIFRIVCLK